MKTYFVIINPASGKGLALKYWAKIKDILKENKIEFKYAFSEYKKHILELVPKLISQGYKKFIAVGGDGTLNEIVNAILKSDFENSHQYTVGIIPFGTGNDWAKTMKIKPNKPEDAVNIISKNLTLKHDIGLIENTDSDSKAQQHYFINIAGFGLDGEICKELVDRRNDGKKIGKLFYYKSIVKHFLRFCPVAVKLKFNEISLKKYITFVSVAMCKYYGNGMMPAKEANPTDGKFKLTIVEGLSTISLISKIRNLFTGNINHYKEVQKHDSLVLEAESKLKTYIQADGEFFGSLPATFKIIPKKINVISNTSEF